MSITEINEIERALNMVMRYVLAGGAFVLTVGAVRPSHFGFLCTDSAHSTVSTALTVLFVLISGVTIYLLHRALVFPILLLCVMSCTIKRKHLPYTPKKLEALLTAKRHAPQQDEFLKRHLATWAAGVHALYGICLGSILGLVSPIFNGCQFSGYVAIVAATAALVLLAAIRHHWRYLAEEIELRGIAKDVA
jgi:hypothetical protein